LNFIFSIVCLFVCVCAFSLRRESPDMILGDKPLIFEVVLSHARAPNARYKNALGAVVTAHVLNSRIFTLIVNETKNLTKFLSNSSLRSEFPFYLKSVDLW
jgi:hypothetical protein